MNARPSFFAQMAESRRLSLRQELTRLAIMADQAADEWAETGCEQACEALARYEELMRRLMEKA